MAKGDDIDLDFFDVRAYLDDKGVHWASEGKNISAGWIGLNCPFCRDASNHFGVNMQSLLISCWKCGKRGSVVALIMALDNCSYNHAKEIVPKYALREFSHLVAPKRNNADKAMFPSGTSDIMLPIHRNFLISRRHDPDFVTRKYDLKFVGPTLDDNKFRLIIPVYLDRKLVTYVGRDTTGKLETPYKNAPIEKSILQAKHCLYGLDEVKDTAVIVEGVLDKWRCGDGFISTFGTKYTKEQILLIARKQLKRVFVLFDGREDDDGEAISYAHDLANDVSSFVKEVEVLELDAGDPDNLSEDDVWHLRKEIGL